MKAAAAYARAKHACSVALRTIRPTLLFREIQAMSEFYIPSRLIATFARHYPDDLLTQFQTRRQHSRIEQGAIDARLYQWIEQNAHTYVQTLYDYYQSRKDEQA